MLLSQSRTQASENGKISELCGSPVLQANLMCHMLNIHVCFLSIGFCRETSSQMLFTDLHPRRMETDVSLHFLPI